MYELHGIMLSKRRKYNLQMQNRRVSSPVCRRADVLESQSQTLEGIKIISQETIRPESSKSMYERFGILIFEDSGRSLSTRTFSSEFDC